MAWIDPDRWPVYEQAIRDKIKDLQNSAVGGIAEPERYHSVCGEYKALTWLIALAEQMSETNNQNLEETEEYHG